MNREICGQCGARIGSPSDDSPLTPTGIEELKRLHDALVREGRPLMVELEALSRRVSDIRERIESADGEEYDGIRLLFAGTFYD